jgi:lipopolysaccharide export system permease protein
LSLDLDRAFVQSSKEIAREDYDYASAEHLRYWVPKEDLIQAMPSVSPREMSSIDVYKEIKRRTLDLNIRMNERRNKITSLAFALEDNLRAGPASPDWNRRTNQLAAFQREAQTLQEMSKDRGLSLYWLEFYKKFSMPFGAFSFIFLAVTLGLMAKRSGQTVGFIFGLIISVIYWALLVGGQYMGIWLNTSPFWSMWLPNILTLSIGLVLTIVRVTR